MITRPVWSQRGDLDLRRQSGLRSAGFSTSQTFGTEPLCRLRRRRPDTVERRRQVAASVWNITAPCSASVVLTAAGNAGDFSVSIHVFRSGPCWRIHSWPASEICPPSEPNRPKNGWRVHRSRRAGREHAERRVERQCAFVGEQERQVDVAGVVGAFVVFGFSNGRGYGLRPLPIQERKDAAAPLLGPFLRVDLDPNVALLMLDFLVTHVADPRQAERLGVSRREAVRTAVSIWGDGALRQRTKLRVPT
jgi:hypothetical protein